MKIKNRHTLVLLACICLFSIASECEADYSCTTVCNRIANCEDEWLVDDAKPPMDDAKRQAYIDQCIDDCTKHSDHDDRDCIMQSSCDEILDGVCS